MSKRNVTELLEAHRSGQDGALDAVFEIVYDELRRLARFQMRGRGNTLDTTALVHEAYLKLSTSEALGAEDRARFMSLASRAMRQIIVDYARARAADKRGGDLVKVPMDGNQIKVDDQTEWILSVEAALAKVRDIDERLEQVFECRFFAGLSEAETAAALGVSVRTVQRDWQRSKAWLRETLGESSAER